MNGRRKGSDMSQEPLREIEPNVSEQDSKLVKAKRQVAAIKGFYVHLFIFALVMLGMGAIQLRRWQALVGALGAARLGHRRVGARAYGLRSHLEANCGLGGTEDQAIDVRMLTTRLAVSMRWIGHVTIG
jgi:hypothetical protein